VHYAADGCPGEAGWNPDHQTATLRHLIEAGGNIHTPDKNGAMPLHRAVRTRCAAAVRLLLDSGANPRAQNKSGSTPFHLAVQNTGRGGSGNAAARAAQSEIIDIFLKHGVSPALQDRQGKTVLESARSAWIKSQLAPH
jgi:ankyrin repeat protein